MQVIRNDFESSKFIAYVDGEVAGSLEYRIKDGQMWLLDVREDRSRRGRQLKSRLVREALAEAGRRRLAVLPFCHEARSQVLAHPVFFRLVPSDQRHRLSSSSNGLRKRAHRGTAGARQAAAAQQLAERHREQGGEAA